jgi:hypothetical protein
MRMRVISRTLFAALFALGATAAQAKEVHRGGASVHHNANVHRNVNANVHRNTNVNVNRNVHVNSAVHPIARAAWARPYRWAPGGAIAAGAAIGFVSAATAAAWAPPPPQPGLCWYYTDSTQRSGFWDTCP